MGEQYRRRVVLESARLQPLVRFPLPSRGLHYRDVVLDCAFRVLGEAERPLVLRDLAERMRERGWDESRLVPLVDLQRQLAKYKTIIVRRGRLWSLVGRKGGVGGYGSCG